MGNKTELCAYLNYLRMLKKKSKRRLLIFALKFDGMLLQRWVDWEGSKFYGYENYDNIYYPWLTKNSTVIVIISMRIIVVQSKVQIKRHSAWIQAFFTAKNKWTTIINLKSIFVVHLSNNMKRVCYIFQHVHYKHQSNMS